MEKKQFSEKEVKGVAELIKKLSDMCRWTMNNASLAFNELAKLAMNAMVVLFMAMYHEQKNIKVSFSNLAKMAFIEAQSKLLIVDMQHSTKRKFLKKGNADSFLFGILLPYKQMSEEISVSFADWIFEAANTNEAQMYEAAKKIATLLELKSLAHQIAKEEYSEKERGILNEIEEYKNIPGVKECIAQDGKIWHKLKEMTQKLRIQNRWKAQPKNVPATILAHGGDTGFFGYLNAVDLGISEEVAGKYYFAGILHDIGEAWIGDVASSLKDFSVERIVKGLFQFFGASETEILEMWQNGCPRVSVLKQKANLMNINQGLYTFEWLENGITLRKIVEDVEEDLIIEKFYSMFSEYELQYIKQFMYEDPENPDKRMYKIVKFADYISAAREGYCQNIHGINDVYYLEANERFVKNLVVGKQQGSKNMLSLLKWYIEESCSMISGIDEEKKNEAKVYVNILNLMIQGNSLELPKKYITEIDSGQKKILANEIQKLAEI